jgi:hypothetical protein
MDWLTWLNTNSEAVTAIATVVYALVTIPLWLATRGQAKITRHMFEAGHRPYVSMMVRQLIPFIEEHQAHLKGTVANHVKITFPPMGMNSTLLV